MKLGGAKRRRGAGVVRMVRAGAEVIVIVAISVPAAAAAVAVVAVVVVVVVVVWLWRGSKIDDVLLDDVPDAALFAQDVVFGRCFPLVVGIVAKLLGLLKPIGGSLQRLISHQLHLYDWKKKCINGWPNFSLN